MKANIDIRNPATVRKRGLNALRNELGTVGLAYFLRQFSVGKGDYTAERETLYRGVTLDDIINDVRQIDSQKQ